MMFHTHVIGLFAARRHKWSQPKRAVVRFAMVALALSGVTAAYSQSKLVKVTWVNRAKVEIQVDTIDNVAKKTRENRKQISPGGQATTDAELDADGYIDIRFSIVGKNDKNISEYRCLDVKTKAAKTQLKYDLSMASGRKC